jgi:spore maturation protein CgeB
MRTFEAPASRAFVLAERSEEQLEFFAEDREAVYYGSPEELLTKLRFYLKRDEARHRIATAGYERCLRSGYAYADRARYMLGHLAMCG